MKYIIAIIVIVTATGFFLNKVIAVQDEHDSYRELDRISLELSHIVQDYERNGNAESMVNAVRYQSEKADQFRGRK